MIAISRNPARLPGLGKQLADTELRMPDDITFQQLREKRLVGARGPPPNPVLILIANELARNKLAGTPQYIISIAAKFGDEFANSGGFRKRAHGYAQAILTYHSILEAEAEAEAEAFASGAICLDEPAATVSQQSLTGIPSDLESRPFIVGTETVQRSMETPTPVQAALTAAAAEAVESGEDFDVEEKLRQLTLESAPPKQGVAGSSAGAQGLEQSQHDTVMLAQELRRDEIDARAAIEEGAGGATPPIKDSLSAADVNSAYKDELRRFWKVNRTGFSEWWGGMSSTHRRRLLLSIAPHMAERPDKGQLTPEMTLSWLADSTNSMEKSSVLQELQAFEALVRHDPQAAARLLNARGGSADRYVVGSRGALFVDIRHVDNRVERSRSLSEMDPRDLIAQHSRMSAAQAADCCKDWQPTVPEKLTQPPGLHRHSQIIKGFMDAISTAGFQIHANAIEVQKHVTKTDGTFEAWNEGQCRAAGLAVDSEGVGAVEHGSRCLTRHWPPRAMGLIWLMEKRADSLWDTPARKEMNRRWQMSEHADDAYDLEVLMILRSQRLEKHSTTPPFNPKARVMVSLGLTLLSEDDREAEDFWIRGHSTVHSDGTGSSSAMITAEAILVARARDAIAIDEDLFRWLMDRQNLISATLLGVAGCYLDQCGKSSTHLLAPTLMHSSSGMVSDAQIKKRLKQMETHERPHAVARSQMAAAMAFLDDGQRLDAEVRFTIAIQLLTSLSQPDFPLLTRAATMLASIVQAPSAKSAAREINAALALGEWPVDLKKVVKEAQKVVHALIPALIEYRKCSFCGHGKRASEFSNNQWLKGKRRCYTCQGSDVTMTLEQLKEAAEQAVGSAEMARLYEEQLMKHCARVHADLARRNEAAPTASECIVCREEWGDANTDQLTIRAVLQCKHQLCASCLFSPDFMPCRCPICREDITAAKVATCKAVAETDPTLQLLASHLPLSSTQRNEVLMSLLQAHEFDVRSRCNWHLAIDDDRDWRMAIEERLWGMVAASPHVTVATTTLETTVPDLTTQQKQQIYDEARRPVFLLQRSLRKAYIESDSPEAIAQLAEKLKAAKENAAADIFARMNLQGLRMGVRTGEYDREEIWQDFHGLHVADAEAKLAQLLEDILPVVGTIVIIMGRGVHSHDGSSKLRMTVEELVKRRFSAVEIQPVARNPGALRMRTSRATALKPSRS